MKELVSVIIPAYNAEVYLTQCLESVMHQTYQELEIIVVNDASTDGTKQMCRDYQKQDERIRVINHKENLGLVAARKSGIREANGKYSVPMDSDDWMDLDAIEKMLEALHNYDCDLVKCGTMFEYENRSVPFKEVIAEGVYDMGDDQSPIYDSFFVNKDNIRERGIRGNIWGAIYKTQLLREYQLLVDDKIRCGEDDACFFPALLEARRYYFMKKPMYHYRQIAASMSHEKGKYKLEEVMLLENRLRKACMGKPNQETLLRQLDYYVVLRLKRYIDKGLVIDYDLGVYLFPYDRIAKGAKVIICGAGKVGRSYVSQIARNHYCEITLWADSHAEKIKDSRVCDMSLVGKAEECDAVVIAVLAEHTAMQMQDELIQSGINAEKIIWCKPEYIGW